jgi:hypothetical protein
MQGGYNASRDTVAPDAVSVRSPNGARTVPLLRRALAFNELG